MPFAMRTRGPKDLILPSDKTSCTSGETSARPRAAPGSVCAFILHRILYQVLSLHHSLVPARNTAVSQIKGAKIVSVEKKKKI